MGCYEVMWLWDLRLKTYENPGRLKYVFHLHFVDFRIEKDAAVNPENMFRRPIIDQPGYCVQVRVLTNG